MIHLHCTFTISYSLQFPQIQFFQIISKLVLRMGNAGVAPDSKFLVQLIEIARASCNGKLILSSLKFAHLHFGISPKCVLISFFLVHLNLSLIYFTLYHSSLLASFFSYFSYLPDRPCVISFDHHLI